MANSFCNRITENIMHSDISKTGMILFYVKNDANNINPISKERYLYLIDKLTKYETIRIL